MNLYFTDRETAMGINEYRMGDTTDGLPSIRCPNADTDVCDYPACKCHEVYSTVPAPAANSTDGAAGDDEERKEQPLDAAKGIVFGVLGGAVLIFGTSWLWVPPLLRFFH